LDQKAFTYGARAPNGLSGAEFTPPRQLVQRLFEDWLLRLRGKPEKTIEQAVTHHMAYERLPTNTPLRDTLDWQVS
jgi:hypothetical protein